MESSSSIMKASVIVATYNRKQCLGELLHSLECQTLDKKAFEIIIIDDGSTDGTWDFLQEYRRSTPLLMRIIRQENSGPGAARNVGANQAEGQVLAFIDSECIAEPQWLERLLNAFDDPRIGVAGGGELPHLHDPFLARCFWFTMNSFLSTGGVRGKSGLRLGKYYPRSFNMAVLKQAFDTCGGFKQAAIYVGGDVELSFNICQRGYQSVFVEGAGVQHRKRVTFLDFGRRVFYLGSSRFQLCQRNPKSIEPIYILPALWLILLPIAIIWTFLKPQSLVPWLVTIPPFLFFSMASILATFRLKSLLAFFAVFISSFIQLCAYGAGFWIASAKWLRNNYASSKHQ